MICLLCDNNIDALDKKFMVAFEVPYINVYVHRSCITNYEDAIRILKPKLESYIKTLKNNKK